MKFGPVPPKKLPEQDQRKVLLLGERWQRAHAAHEKWAVGAKQAMNFMENRSYTDDELATARRKGRPALKFNIIAPIVRLVVGYHGKNRSDITYSPANDWRSNEDIATALTQVEKAINTGNNQEFIDPEVFLEGLITGRGWFDTRLDWEDNDLGELKTTSLDPFLVKMDPDCDTYDINESASYLQIDRMVSIDEIEGAFGPKVADLVRPFTMGQTPLSPLSSVILNGDTAPIRAFGQREDSDRGYWDDFYSLMGDFADTHRKTIRIIETQYKVRELRDVFIDLETGDRKVIPQDWDQDRIQKCLYHAKVVNNPLIVQRRMVQRIHWTTMVGDTILYDAPSMYDKFTPTGYFPYFRRGVARGMVEDLIDAQKEKNKSRSNRVEIESKTANGGWIWHKDSLDPVDEAKLKSKGSTPGFNLKWKGDKEPKKIEPSMPSTGYERLELSSDQDLRRISGVNEAALGDEDNRAVSGRAILARQQQAVVSVQMYMDNFRRTKHALGRQHLYGIQTFYTEQRIYRVTGEDGKRQPIEINQMLVDPASGAKRMLNDVTVGRYAVVVDDAPLSPSFAAAQFDETMTLLEKFAPVLGNNIGMFADLIIGMSSLPRKEEWIQRFQQLMAMQFGGQPQQVPPGGGQPQPGGGQPQQGQPQVPQQQTAALTPAETGAPM